MTVPNLLSMFRIVLVPVFIFTVLSGTENAYLFGMAVFLLAGITDVLDGYLARKYNCTSVLGKFLDPMADKMMVASALVCAVIEKLVPLWLALAYIAKELIQAIGGFVFYNKVKDMMPSNVLGKAATTTFYLTIFSAFIFRRMPHGVLTALEIVCGLLLVATFVTYLRLGLKASRKCAEEKNNEN